MSVTLGCFKLSALWHSSPRQMRNIALFKCMQLDTTRPKPCASAYAAHHSARGLFKCAGHTLAEIPHKHAHCSLPLTSYSEKTHAHQDGSLQMMRPSPICFLFVQHKTVLVLNQCGQVHCS